MTRQMEEKSLLAEIIGSEITIPSTSTLRNGDENILRIVSDDLYNSLANFLGSSAPFFQAALPLDRIIKYKDGSFSSIEKSIKGGFGQHQGFHLLSNLRIASEIMSHVIPQLNARLTAIYSDLLSQNNDLLNQIQDVFITPEIGKLKSIQEFMREVANDIEEISKSPQLSTATLTNLQQRRIDLKTTFHTFFTRLKNSVDGSFFDLQAIANNYLTTRHALSGYMASLVLECVVSGNMDNKSVSNLKSKVTNCIDELNSITDRLFQILSDQQYSIKGEIRNIDSFYGWTYDYIAQNKINTLHSHDQSIEAMKYSTLKQFDIKQELARIDEFINARQSFLKKIEIAPQSQE